MARVDSLTLFHAVLLGVAAEELVAEYTKEDEATPLAYPSPWSTNGFRRLSNTNSSDTDELDDGAIVAIVLGSIAGVILIAAAGYWLWATYMRGGGGGMKSTWKQTPANSDFVSFTARAGSASDEPGAEMPLLRLQTTASGAKAEC